MSEDRRPLSDSELDALLGTADEALEAAWRSELAEQVPDFMPLPKLWVPLPPGPFGRLQRTWLYVRHDWAAQFDAAAEELAGVAGLLKASGRPEEAERGRKALLELKEGLVHGAVDREEALSMFRMVQEPLGGVLEQDVSDEAKEAAADALQAVLDLREKVRRLFSDQEERGRLLS
ncbi:hypothetical protein J0910_30010 [Nocardiopsis sp. CNT-189]|uniref:hypothetical protein n=1 Tax=Nocardiopsis oceanisediminis TaxID=2816862 RepID=UPI003B345AD2